MDVSKSNSKRPPTSAKWKLLSSHEDMGNKPTVPMLTTGGKEEGLDEERTNKLSSGEEEEACDVELPPPMQIQERTFPAVPSQDKSQHKRSSSLALKPPGSAVSPSLSSEIDHIGKQKMEQGPESVTESLVEDDTSEEGDDFGRNESLIPDSCIGNETRESGIFCHLSPDGMGEPLTKEEEKDQALTKRVFVMKELVETERDYVRDLGIIVEGYMELMKDKNADPPMPEPLRNGKDKMVFGNIEQIFEFHRDTFLAELEKCLEEPSRLGVLFRRYDRKLHMYVVYCQNKPVSEYIVSEYIDTYFEELRQKLGHKLQLPDMLIKPVQRIMKYQLLLKDILKYTERAGLQEECEVLQKATQVMHVVPKAANDMMNVGRLQGFDGKVSAQGKLLLQDVLSVAEGCSAIGFKGKENQVFLFEQIIIFSDIIGKKTQFSNPIYKYKAHIQVNKLALQEKADDGDPLKFVLQSKCPLQPGLAFVLQAASLEVYHVWVSEIRAILDTQLDFLRAIQSPIAYQKELTKEISAPELGSLWNPTLRKTLSHPPTPSSTKGGDSVKQRRSAREKKVKSTEGVDRKLTVTSPGCGPRGDASSTKLPSLPCSPTEEVAEGRTVSDGSCFERQGGVGGEQRKHSLPLDKRVTTTTTSMQSPPKSRRHFLEGFRNPLRPKSKTEQEMGDAAVLTEKNGSGGQETGAGSSLEVSGDGRSTSLDSNQKLGEQGGSGRRWSETNSNAKSRPTVRHPSSKITEPVIQ